MVFTGLLPTTLNLPEKASDLIRVALADLETIEADPRYMIDMEMWHKPNSHCKVCLAGAVMAARVDAPKEDLVPSSFGRHTGVRLSALNEFRKGDTWDGVMRISKIYISTKLEKQTVARYEDDPVAFKADMNRMADYLEAKGF